MRILSKLLNPIFRAGLRRLGTSLVILLAIAYLTLAGLIASERGKAGLPVRPSDIGVEALRQTLNYLVNHPLTYHWQRADIGAPALVLTLLARSAALLLGALGIAALAGVPLGMAAALLRRGRAAPWVLLASILGVSTPSFLLGMLFWSLNIQLYRRLGLDSALLPPTGFGWDAHLVMPILVLATRPLAQVVHITYVSLTGVLGEDYVRTARAKGLAWRVVVGRHAIRNVLIPILTTLGTSLRFSLASLPVVEVFFVWPGVGLALLQAIESGTAPLVTDMIVSLGFLFLLVNLMLDVIYKIIDPRLRQAPEAIEQDERQLADLESWTSDFGNWISNLSRQASSIVQRARSGYSFSRKAPAPARAQAKAGPRGDSPPKAAANRRPALWAVRMVLRNLPLLIGALLALALVWLAVYGETLAAASPYETHGIMVIEGKVAAPPFAPSTLFPWGSDPVGRDVQALVLAGAKQTLSLALLAMLARVAVGAILGVLAGWQPGSWLDRLIHGVVSIWAAFPVTLFAMILILALGIQQGVSIFVAALCLVGWGEIAQFVRGQVMGLRPQLYIEAARSVGARASWILTRHVLPHLWAPLLTLAVLEMGSILMLLAELGFLNVFLGGGFKVEIGEVGKMVPVIYYFSDVPEWGALLANIRNWWRSYPWLAWYPGAAFFAAILTFNLWGEGLRRLLEDSRINIGRLINRYTAAAAAVIVLGSGWLMRSAVPLETYNAQAQQLDVQRALEHIETLASPSFQGRESGTPGARAAADYIAAQMEDIGLTPGGEKGAYVYAISALRPHLAGLPRLEILDNAPAETLIYRRDFVEYVRHYLDQTEGEGAVVGLAMGPDAGQSPPSLRELDLRDRVVLVREADMERFMGNSIGAAGVLVVPRTDVWERKYLYPPEHISFQYDETPIVYVTPQLAERLLAAAGGLAQLDALAKGMAPGQLALTEPGAQVRLAIPILPADLSETYDYVIGFIPGAGAATGEEQGKGLDNRVIIVSAYYDGLGTGPEGMLYPSANDNASGVAAMLEIARLLKSSSLEPRKTIMFVAWSGGERKESLSVTYAMNAGPGLNTLTVEAIIELSGVGAGDGEGLALGAGTSFSLVQLFQQAAGRVGVPITTRGRGPHFGQTAQSGYGGRSALSAYVSWDGSDRLAHTARDALETIDPEKLEKAGRVAFLAVSTLGQAEAQRSAAEPLARGDDYRQGARMFDEEQALAHVTYLASDDLTGRRPGTPGGRAAGEYIAAHLAEYGLQPGGIAGSYFQTFTVPITRLVEMPVLVVARQGVTRTYNYRTDYMARTRGYLGAGKAEGQVIWLNECNRKDWAGQDMAGKIAFCRNPEDANVYSEMIEQARQHKAGGLLLLCKRSGEQFPRGAVRIDPETIPAFCVTETVARDLLAGTAYTLDDLDGRLAPTPLLATARMAVAFQEQPAEARNVLGLLPGSDPDHRDEIVIIGAHYDHIGQDPDGAVYNGANDNASGVSAMLEIARLWQAQGFQPARSVLFAAWDDEEDGRNGSGYYVRRPVYPLDHTVAVLNMDVIGVGQDLHLNGQSPVADHLWTTINTFSVTAQFDGWVGGSDHVPFHEMSVPSAMLIWDSDPAYHTTQDDVQNIHPARLRTAGVLMAQALAAWSGGGPAIAPPGERRSLRDLILPTPTCAPPWPPGAMTCDHGEWSR